MRACVLHERVDKGSREAGLEAEQATKVGHSPSMIPWSRQGSAVPSSSLRGLLSSAKKLIPRSLAHFTAEAKWFTQLSVTVIQQDLTLDQKTLVSFDGRTLPSCFGLGVRPMQIICTLWVRDDPKKLKRRSGLM